MVIIIARLVFLYHAVPTLNVSRHFLVLQYSGRVVISEFQPSVTCLPSDPRAPVRWRSDGLVYPNLDPRLPLSFSPRGLNHTATLPNIFGEFISSSFLVLICDLVNVELRPDEDVNAQLVIIILTQSKSCNLVLPEQLYFVVTMVTYIIVQNQLYSIIELLT